jgi:hypothetical protein
MTKSAIEEKDSYSHVFCIGDIESSQVSVSVVSVQVAALMEPVVLLELALVSAQKTLLALVTCRCG